MMTCPAIRQIAMFGIAISVLAITTSALAQAPAGSNWDYLKALPAQTKIHVSADKGGGTCKLLSVDDATLICGKHTFQRADVKSVKLTRYGVSTAVGAGIGAGIGVGVGIGLAGGKDSFFGDDKGKFAAAGAGIGAVLGGLITGPADLFRGPTVYRMP
ncbi:hypothetical protein HDF16_001736 [Granulicella aggregans]|uniref:Glycine zipper domain-containing protein n=2 Tax=Granulicella aggregans TaxID=474949 RepID=A0A7W7ZBX3_9BACT|nr:hypothetical protein [Granulicella aggregans]